MKQTKIKSLTLNRLSNVLHTNFHEAMYLITSAVPVPDQKRWQYHSLLAAWKASIDVEKDISREAQDSKETINIQALDTKRDELTAYIFGVISLESKCGPIEARRAAAKRLTRLTKVYPGLAREGYNEQTTHTDGFLVDAAKTEEAADLQTLGLDTCIAQLQAANDEFRTKILERSALKVQTKLPNTREQRKVSDDIYKRICILLQASFLTAENDAERTRINHLVSLINQRTEELRQRHNQSTAQTGSTSTNKDGKTIIPDPKSSDTTTPSTWEDGTAKADGE